MEKKKIQNVLKRVMARALSLLLAFSGFQLTGLRAQAAEFNFDNCISDVTVYQSGCLKSMKVKIVPKAKYGDAYGKIAVHSQESQYSFDKKRYLSAGQSDWSLVNDDYLKTNDGLLAWSSGAEFKWTDWYASTNGSNVVSVEFSDAQIDLNKDGTYYIYLWTRSSTYGIYPDVLLGTISAGDGKLKLGTQEIVSIKKAEIETAPVAIANLTYTGKPLSLVTSGQVKDTDSSKIQYRIGANGAWSNEVPTATAAGTYEVYYKPVGKAGSGNILEGTVGGPITVKIDPRPVTVIPVSGQQKEYGETDPTFKYEVKGLSEGDLGTSFTGALSRENVEIGDVGTYKIIQGTLTSANYKITFKDDVIFKIVPRSAPSEDSIPADEKPTASNPRYSAVSPVALITAPSKSPFEIMNGYTIQYSLDKNNVDGWTTDINTITASTIGNHIVYYRYVNNDLNHEPMPVDAIFELKSKVRGAATVTDSNGEVTEYGTFAEAAAAWGQNGVTLTL